MLLKSLRKKTRILLNENALLNRSIIEKDRLINKQHKELVKLRRISDLKSRKLERITKEKDKLLKQKDEKIQEQLEIIRKLNIKLYEL